LENTPEGEFPATPPLTAVTTTGAMPGTASAANTSVPKNTPTPTARSTGAAASQPGGLPASVWAGGLIAIAVIDAGVYTVIRRKNRQNPPGE
jgi:hypothetical protein